MRIITTFGTGLAVAMALASTLSAQTAEGGFSTVPAEMPPADYAGLRYVDSRGCVFRREGADWAPMLDADGRPACGGRAPTASITPAADVTPTPRPDIPELDPAPVIATEEVVVMPDAAPAAPQEIATIAPQPIAPMTDPGPTRTVRTRAVQAQVVPVRPAIVLASGRAPVPPGCSAADAAADYLVNSAPCAMRLVGHAPVGDPIVATAPAEPRRPMRRDLRPDPVVRTFIPATPSGPARTVAEPGATAPRPIYVTAPDGAVWVNPNAPSPFLERRRALVAVPPGALDRPVRRVTVASSRGYRDASRPAPVLVRPARTTYAISGPPPGYRAAWDDGRLNPHRGPRTLEGDYQSQVVWTNETPRRLRRFVYVTD